MSTVITVENLGKRYLLSHQTQRQPYVALRDVIAEKTNAIGRRLLHPFQSSKLAPRSSDEEFWALKDVSFEIKQGDRVGIIGRNGAGKSTLLKILSRIIEPTTGRVRIKGRVASLLEVGTGFHPELTGRENIYLNGAILGMTRAEIKKKFDEIVDFAEIEKFLDTPVKRYSSGMYVRLAFAVAAHLEPEILLVDEVLAVGDAQFQKKCLGKMEDVSAREGRTVLFVSHNMAAILTLCTTGVLFRKGVVTSTDCVDSVVAQYIDDMYLNPQIMDKKTGNRFQHICIISPDGEEKHVLTSNTRYHLSLRLFVESSKNLNCGITIYNSFDSPLLSSCILDTFTELGHGSFEYRLELPVEFLHSGSYRIEGAIWDDHNVYDKNDTLCNFNVVRSDSILEIRGSSSRGYMRLPGRWVLGI